MASSSRNRRQATLFFDITATALTQCRQSYNPVQAALIPAHVTLCREDEVLDWADFERRVSLATPFSLTMKFGRPIRNVNSVLLPAVEGMGAYASLRRTLLVDGTSVRRRMDAHVTLIHPRNGLCTDAIFAAIDSQLQPFEWTFHEISLIEQQDGGVWKTLSRYR
jgi:hypothetical protein